MGRRLVLLVSSAALLLLLGLIYAYSVLLNPLKEEFGWPVSGMTLIFALSMAFFTMGNLVAGSIVKGGRERAGLLAASALLLAGFLGTAMVSESTSLAVSCVSYGVVASFGIGLVYNIVIPTVTAWFPDRCGLAQGFCLMGFGMGGFVLGPIVTGAYAVADWRLVVGVVGVALSASVVAALFVLRPPSVEDLAATGGMDWSEAGAAEDWEGADAREMLRTPSFWNLYAFLFLMGCSGMGVTGMGIELPLSLGASGMAATLVIGLVNVGSGLGRFFCGVALDRLGSALMMVLVCALSVLASLLMICSLLSGLLWVQAIACLLVGTSWGSAVVTMPFVTRRRWGQRNMAQNMAIVNTYSIAAAIVGSWGSGLLLEVSGSFYPVLGSMVVMGVAGLAITGRRGKADGDAR